MAIKIKGNIETLLDYKKVEKNQHPTMGESCFASMFKNCADIVQAPSLLSTSLAKECYSNMFGNCNLTSLPKISATDFSDNSIKGMFFGNSAITSSTANITEDMLNINETGYIEFRSASGMDFYITIPLTEEEQQARQEAFKQGGSAWSETKWWKCWDGIMEVSTDAINWREWEGDDSATSQNGVLYVRGTNNHFITKYSNIGGPNAKSWSFTVNDIECNGNIENLLDYQTVLQGKQPTMGTGCFCNMFDNNLIKAPKLPSKELADYCYAGMFHNALISQMPKLPATELTVGCYMNMFSGCKQLVNEDVIKLPAKKLTHACYNNMFTDCESVYFSELPATELADYCYMGMFYGNANTRIPKLPATKLTKGCYSSMFQNSVVRFNSELELPAKKNDLAENCYDNMLTGISHLSKVHFSNTISTSEAESLLGNTTHDYTITCDL